jgi:uncharacterized protein DUF4342
MLRSAAARSATKITRNPSAAFIRQNARTSGGDFASIIAGMDFRTHYEEFKVQARDLVEKVHSLVREGNIRRIIIKDDKGNTFIEIPLTVGVVTALAIPVLAGLGAIAALVANFTIGVERTLRISKEEAAAQSTAQERQ